jgi:hypothetical protein
MKMDNTAKLGMLLPTVLNPATAVVGIGLGLIWLLRHDQDEATNEPVKIKRLPPPAQTAAKPLPTVEALVEEVVRVADQAVPATIPDADQKEMIRSAMSELGKRSAAARAIKKAERENKAG